MRGLRRTGVVRRIGLRGAAALTAIAIAPHDAIAQRATSSIEVRFTPYGVAHVRAGTLAGAGEGYGWAFARDNLCLMVDKAVTLAGERSRFLSADSSYFDGFLGGPVTNIASDVAYRYLLTPTAVSAVRTGASADVQALVSGYVRGFNRHARDAAQPGEDCRTQPWFRPLTEHDVWRRLTQMPLLQTSIILLREIAAAAPPGKRDASRSWTTPDLQHTLAHRTDVMSGSNALAAGRGILGTGAGGFSFSNPHFPWRGTERLHALHLTVPGQLDVFGATLYGIPFPMLGFSAAVGWSLTHTTDKRSTIYELALDAANPTRYRIGDHYEAMRPVTIVVPTTADTIRRTVWETRYGPVFVAVGLPWSNEHAYAFADPERGNVRMADQFYSFSTARSVRDVQASLRRYLGSPWSNVTAADRRGEVLYANISVAAYITDAQWARCRVAGQAAMYENLGDVTVLNGADPTCAWTLDARAPQPGIIPAALRPSTVRQDVTFNSNDSHWLPTWDVSGVLEGFPQVIGPERTMRGERTRVAALYARTFDPKDALRRTVLTPAAFEARFFSARNLLAELVLDDLVADCGTSPTVVLETGATADLTASCTTLSAWDRTDRLTARGSMLFSEFVRNLERVPMTGFAIAARYWREPFDVRDPIGTPRGFVPSLETRRALARAAARLTTAGIALGAPLGDVQAAVRSGRRLPLSGASYTYHQASPANLMPGQGVTELRSGDSYIHAVALGAHAPRGRFMVTYSQSTNSASPHFADMTAVFSQQQWIDVVFTEQDIRNAQVGPTVRWRR